MGEADKIRILLLEDDVMIRELLTKILTERGYEVYPYDTPAVCPLQEEKNCRCSEKQTCFDIILSDLDMPILNGLDFLESQKKKKCKCESVAIMSGNITEDARLRAEKIDIELFEKPVSLKELFGWFDKVEKNIDKDRVLLDWFLK